MWNFPGHDLSVGRAPQCELRFDGEGNDVVSNVHARITLEPAHALLTDLTSSNGTFLNDRRVTRPTAIQVGDRISFGFTGPQVKVIKLDFPASPANTPESTAPRDTPPSRPIRKPRLASWVAGALLLLLVAVAVLFWSRRPAAQPSTHSTTANVATPANASPDVPSSADSPPAVVDVQQLGQRFQDAIVFLGVEDRSSPDAEPIRLLFCTGWAVAPQEVVGLADWLHTLRQVRNDHRRIFVAQIPGADGQLRPIYVSDVQTHPQFQANSATSPNPLHNVGILLLEKPLPLHIAPASQNSAPVSLPDLGSAAVLGFHLPQDPQSTQPIATFDAAHPPRFQALAATWESPDPSFAVEPPVQPRLLRVNADVGFDGAAVLDHAGRPLGILWRIPDSPLHRVYPIALLTGWR